MITAPRGLRADGEMTRTRLLEAAGELFASTGFAETTSKAIAARAGADLASINYHFGSRDGLYQSVLVEAHRRLLDPADLQQLTQSPLSAAKKLKILIEQLVQQATGDAKGWHLTVLAAEALTPTSHGQVLYRPQAPAKTAGVMSLLRDITGIPIDDPALQRCMLSVAAPCLLLLISKRNKPWPQGARPWLHGVQQMPHKEIVEHLYEFAMAGLKTIGKEYARNKETSKSHSSSEASSQMEKP